MSSLQELKRKQITSLLSISALEIVPDSQYCVTRTNYTLHIFLPPQFPSIPPSILVKPLIQSPFVNHQGYIVHEKLSQWNLNVSVGKVISDIIQDLEKSVSSNISTSMLQSPLSLPGFDLKTKDELNELLSDDTTLHDYVDTIPQMQDMTKVEQEIVTANAQLANKNLTKKQEIEELKLRVKALQELNSNHRKKLDELLSLQHQQLAKFGSDHLTEQLRHLVSESESMSELSTTSYLEGKLTEEEFIRAFKAARKIYHMRSEKLERISETIHDE